MTCLSYLGFRYFDANITDDEMDRVIAKGEYVLYQYAQSNFLHHIRGAWRQVGGTGTIVRESAKKFLKEKWNPSFNSEPPHSFSILEHIQSMDSEDHRKLRIIAAHRGVRNLAESPNGLWTRLIDF